MNIRSDFIAVPLENAPSETTNKAFFVAAGLEKAFGPNTVLSDVSFNIPKGSVVSIIGENGAGKSTLLNILSGLMRSDSGTLQLDGKPFAPVGYGEAIRAGVSRVFQEQSLVLQVPVYENLILGFETHFVRFGQVVDRRAAIAAAQKMVDEAGIDVDVRRRTGDYDFSRRQSIEIARACLQATHLAGVQHPFILLDEPTSALDRRDEKAFFDLLDRLRKRSSLLFVSHRLSEVLAHSDLIYVLKDGKLVARLRPDEADESRLHSLMVGRERAADYYFEKRQRADIGGQTPIVLDVKSLSGHDYEDISLSVRAGEIVGIGGLLDSGKSPLGKGIAGVVPPAEGTVVLGEGSPFRPQIRKLVQAGLAYIPAERLTEGLIAGHRLSWNLSLASGYDLFVSKLGLWRSKRETAAARNYIASLAIRSGTPTISCARLSGGNQQKVVLARWLVRNPGVLVLDNPTRGVDAGAKQEIYRIIRDLADKGAGIILITDELMELIGLSNRVLIMQRGRLVKEVAAPIEQKPEEKDLVASMLPGGVSSERSKLSPDFSKSIIA